MIITRILTELQPTEKEEAIIRVLQNFSDIDESIIEKVEEIGKTIYRAKFDSLEGLYKFYNGLRSQRIVESARKFLFARMRQDSVSFLLNKQALFMGTFHFCSTDAESPMGPVWIKIESDNIERLLEYLVPPTEKGKPLEVNYIPE